MKRNGYTLHQHAANYGVSVSLIQQWKAKGYPLDDVDKMRRIFLSGQLGLDFKQRCAFALNLIDAHGVVDQNLIDEYLDSSPAVDQEIEEEEGELPHPEEDDSPEGDDKLSLRDRKIKIETERLLFRHQIELGNYVSLDEVKLAGAELGNLMKTELMQLRMSLPTLLYGKDRKTMQIAIDAEVTKVIHLVCDKAEKIKIEKVNTAGKAVGEVPGAKHKLS